MTRSAPTVRESPARSPSKTSAPRVDQQHAVAEPLDVAHVVGGQQQGRAVGAALGDQELAQPLLGEHVEADGGLVEHDQRGGVQQCRGHLGAHPLAQRELTHRGAEEIAHLQALHQLLGAGALGGGVRGSGSRPGSGTTRAHGRSHHSCERCPKTTPTRRARRRRSSTGRSPQVRTVPEVGTRMPVSILMVVDLPAPLAPM